MSNDSTVVIICGDRRLHTRDEELFDHYSKRDDTPPYRAMLPGGCLPYQDYPMLHLSLRPFVLKGITHIHHEDHMGNSEDVSGCAAYLNMQRYCKEIGAEVGVTTGIYRHDEPGTGTFEPIDWQKIALKLSRSQTAYF